MNAFDVTRPTDVFVPLDTDTLRPVDPAWNTRTYAGLSTLPERGSVAIRCDTLVVVRCPTEQSLEVWLGGHPKRRTRVVSTPCGFDCHYRWVPGAPTGPTPLLGTDLSIYAGCSCIVGIPPTSGFVEAGTTRPAAFEPWWLAGALFTSAGVDLPVNPIRRGRGERHQWLASLAASARVLAVDPERTEALLQVVNEDIIPPISAYQVSAIVESVYEAEPWMKADATWSWRSESELRDLAVADEGGSDG